MFIILLLNKSDTMALKLSKSLATYYTQLVIGAIFSYGINCTPALILAYISKKVDEARAAADADTENTIVSGNLQDLEAILIAYIDEQYLECIVKAKTDAKRIWGSNFGPSDISICIFSQVRVAEKNFNATATTDENIENAKHELHYAQVMYNTHIESAFAYFRGKI
jgi:hypothetical protein